MRRRASIIIQIQEQKKLFGADVSKAIPKISEDFLRTSILFGFRGTFLAGFTFSQVTLVLSALVASPNHNPFKQDIYSTFL